MDPMEIVRTNEDQFNDRSFREKAEQVTAASITVIDAPADREFQGVDGYKQYREGLIAALPDIQESMADLKVSGNEVTANVRRTGTFTGEMPTPDGTVPGNGKKLDIICQCEWEIEDDKITRFTENYDMQDLMSQLGMG